MVHVSNIKLGICLLQVSYIATFRLGSFWCIKCHKILHKAVRTCSFIFLLYYFISLVLLIPKCVLLTSVDQVNNALHVLSVVTVILWDLASCLMSNRILEEPAAESWRQQVFFWKLGYLPTKLHVANSCEGRG